MSGGVRTDSGSDEARLARRVSAYDDAVAGGTSSNHPNDAHPALDHAAFLKARECIDLLNLVWPRAKERHAVRQIQHGIAEGEGAGADIDRIPRAGDAHCF